MDFLSKVKRQLSLIEEKDKEFNAFLFLRSKEDILKDAEIIQKKIDSNYAGKLAGFTFGLKSNINFLNVPVNCASKVLEDYKGSFYADVVVKLLEEDALFFGMLNMDEFAAGGSGLHSAFNPAVNPFDKSRIAGGSSSGSAVSVALDFVDFSLGTDTGGSIRNPASHCGVIGIKPSYGRVSRHGVVDLSMSLDQIGVFSKNVFLSGLVLEVISGYSEKDATSMNVPVGVYSKSNFNVEDFNIKILDLSDLFVSEEVKKVFFESVKILEEKLNRNFEVVKIPNFDLAVSTYYPLVYTEFFSATRRFDGRKYGKKIEDFAGEEVLRRIIAGSKIASVEDENQFYRKSLAVKNFFSSFFESFFEDTDILLLPTVPVLPRRIDSKVLPEEEYGEDSLTIPANLAGISAASFPVGFFNNLPVGLQVYTNKFEEEKLFSFLFFLEKVFEKKLEF